ncbi:hypothetical protein KBD81_01430 [Candidatus Woesebacteria bacterium]|nr:hypothetical protein [Candidatus Woesebacteria bacterium]
MNFFQLILGKYLTNAEGKSEISETRDTTGIEASTLAVRLTEFAKLWRIVNCTVSAFTVPNASLS